MGIIVWNLFPVKLRNHPTVEERSPVLNAGQGRSLRERPSLSCIVLRPAWMVSPGDMLRMLARVRNLVSADQQQDLGPAATFRPGLLQSHLPNSCPGIQELDSVFASRQWRRSKPQFGKGRLLQSLRSFAMTTWDQPRRSAVLQLSGRGSCSIMGPDEGRSMKTPWLRR